jgi:hypothetical protein
MVLILQSGDTVSRLSPFEGVPCPTGVGHRQLKVARDAVPVEVPSGAAVQKSSSRGAQSRLRHPTSQVTVSQEDGGTQRPKDANRHRSIPKDSASSGRTRWYRVI